MGFFGSDEASKGTIDEVSGLIQNFFNKIGISADQQRLQSANGNGWWVNRGSAVIYIFVQDSQTGAFIRVVSPIVYMPTQNLLPFYRKLLDSNNNLLGCGLATDKDVVLLVAQRPTLGIGQEELDALVDNLARVADTLDNELAAEFGARVYSETPQ